MGSPYRTPQNEKVFDSPTFLVTTCDVAFENRRILRSDLKAARIVALPSAPRTALGTIKASVQAVVGFFSNAGEARAHCRVSVVFTTHTGEQILVACDEREGREVCAFLGLGDVNEPADQSDDLESGTHPIALVVRQLAATTGVAPEEVGVLRQRLADLQDRVRRGGVLAEGALRADIEACVNAIEQAVDRARRETAERDPAPPVDPPESVEF